MWAKGRWGGQEDMEEEGWSQVTAVTDPLKCSARKEGAERGRERRRAPFQEGWAGAEPPPENPDSCTAQGWRDGKAEDRVATREQ